MKIPGFKIERLIAEGGMASVYLAVQESLNRRVALKVLRKFDSSKQAERFLHEGRIIASLNHRNIITIHDIGAVGDQHYIAMEYLEGGSLGDRIDEGMQLPEALDLVESIAACLEFVHRREIVHRDVKPSNILFHADGTPKLTDFGIAKQLDEDQDLTMDGSALGSPYYLSPEQAEGRTLDGRSDIYGLGIILYQMLTGQRPYAERSHVETIVAHLTHPVPVLPDEFSSCQDLLDRMIAKAPENRVASAQELVDLVRAVRLIDSKATAGGAENGLARQSGKWLRWLAEGGADVWRSSSIEFKIALAMLALALGIGTFLLQRDLGIHQETAVEAHWVPDADVPVRRMPERPVPELSRAKAEAEPETEEMTVVPPLPVATPVDTPQSLEPGDPELAQAAEPEPDNASVVQDTEVPLPALESAVMAPDQFEQSIDRWLKAADQALEEYRLTTPPDDNAYAYYQKVMVLDPAHQEGRAGITKIAERYAALARRELTGRDYRKARLYVRRGLGVEAGNSELLALRAQLEESQRAHPGTSDPRSRMSYGDTRPSEPGSESWQAPKGTGNIVKDFKSVWQSIFN